MAHAEVSSSSWAQWLGSASEEGHAAPEQIGLAAGALSEEAVHSAWSAVLGFPRVSRIPRQRFSRAFLSQVPIAFARRWGMIGLCNGDAALTVVTHQPFAGEALANVSRLLGCAVRVALCGEAEVQQAINDAYESHDQAPAEVIEELDWTSLGDRLHQWVSGEDLLDAAGKAPVIRLVNLLLLEAVKRRASDVHIQPAEGEVIVRLRIDGVLYDHLSLPRGLLEGMVSRVKVMGQMDISERRLAQDGRASVEVGGKQIDLRIASLPTNFGERVVLRLLDKSARLYHLPELGMDAGTLSRFERLIEASHGIILVTGPTGSGKSTTLYSVLQRIDTATRNVITLEDPIEYKLAGISQTQVADRKGMTFASGLRHVLRQDPDVIMVGEIRDSETARMAVQSALTGHLVFSTLHTNDAASAVARMLDLGVEPYLVASCLIGVLAQRLVRRVCPDCASSAVLSVGQMRRLGLDSGADVRGVREGRGCASCLQTGYRGREGVFELLLVDETIRELIHSRAKAGSIKSAARREGLRTLREDGLSRILSGVTTASEVLRVSHQDEL